MPLHQPSPDFADLQRKVHAAKDGGARFLALFSGPNLDDSKYLHWEQLQRRTPPLGLSMEEWWLKLKIQRKSQSRSIPLTQKNGTQFTFSMTDEVLQLSEEIARRTGGGRTDDSDALTAAGRSTYVVRSLVEEAITSSQLEGASTSRRAAIELLDSGRDPLDTSEQMIVNNYLAMQQIAAGFKEPLTPDWILDLHSVLCYGTLDDPSEIGRLQTPSDVRVKVWAGDECVHIPPPARELPHRLKQLCEFSNGSSADSPYIPPVVRAIITHFMFGYDHYFADGNGRTARLAFYWSMLHNGYWLAEYLTISNILRKAPGQYGDSYQYSEDDDGDLTYFILHQLRVVRRALDELDAYIDGKQTETRRVREALQSATRHFNSRQIQIIEWLAREDVVEITAEHLARKYQVSSPTARGDLARLEQFGLVHRGVSKHPIVWTPSPDVPARLRQLASE